jgi:hypothetical protein
MISRRKESVLGRLSSRCRTLVDVIISFKLLGVISAV